MASLQLVLVSVLAWCAISGGKAEAYTLTLGAPALQKAVEAYFPITQENALGAITLSNPRVILRPNSRRIGLATNVSAAMPEQPPLTGSGVVHGEITYDAVRHEFQFRDPRVASLVIDGVAGPFATLVESAVEAVTQSQFPVIVLYRLDEETLRQAPQLRMLKAVGVRNGALVLELGL